MITKIVFIYSMATLLVLPASSFVNRPHLSIDCLGNQRTLNQLNSGTSSPLEDETLKSTVEKSFGTISAKSIDDNELEIITAEDGSISAQPRNKPTTREQSAKPVPNSGFNVVLTHCTADFDSLASAVGLAKLWSAKRHPKMTNRSNFDSGSHVPTYVVLPRGSHPAVQRFLALHKHLFPIRSLKSLPDDLSALNRLGLVDAQRRDRIGPAAKLLGFANRITVVDHHLESDSDIECTDYVLDKVGSVSTLIVERLRQANLGDSLTEAEATLLALGIHADTGSLCYDSTTPRDAAALSWVLEQGASQVAIAEHAQSTLSAEQQSVLTQALANTNFTVAHGVTISSVLLRADGFINGLASCCTDLLEITSSQVYLLGFIYSPSSGGQRKKKNKQTSDFITAKLFTPESNLVTSSLQDGSWKGGEDWQLRRRLRAAFDKKDKDESGFLEREDVSNALVATGTIVSRESLDRLIEVIDTNADGKIDFEEFVAFARKAQEIQRASKKKPCNLVIIGRAKPGADMEGINLGKLLEKFGGGGHPKAASATIRLNDDSEALEVMSNLVHEVIETSLRDQPTVGDFMTSPVLSVHLDNTEAQIESLFIQYDVRALPVVDDRNYVVGLVTYKEVAAAKQRLWNKEQKRLRDAASPKRIVSEEAQRIASERRRHGSPVKAWMKQHVTTVEASRTMKEVERILLENDVGCIPVVKNGKLVGMVTRTDLLRQHRYYSSLHYHNKGFSNRISDRDRIIAQGERLKINDIDDGKR